MIKLDDQYNFLFKTLRGPTSYLTEHGGQVCGSFRILATVQWPSVFLFGVHSYTVSAVTFRPPARGTYSLLGIVDLLIFFFRPVSRTWVWHPLFRDLNPQSVMIIINWRTIVNNMAFVMRPSFERHRNVQRTPAQTAVLNVY